VRNQVENPRENIQGQEGVTDTPKEVDNLENIENKILMNFFKDWLL